VVGAALTEGTARSPDHLRAGVSLTNTPPEQEPIMPLVPRLPVHPTPVSRRCECDLAGCSALRDELILRTLSAEPDLTPTLLTAHMVRAIDAHTK
jgi:hypothetical protein